MTQSMRNSNERAKHAEHVCARIVKQAKEQQNNIKDKRRERTKRTRESEKEAMKTTE